MKESRTPHFVKPLQRFEQDFNDLKLSPSLIVALYINGLFKAKYFTLSVLFFVGVQVYKGHSPLIITLALLTAALFYIPPIRYYVKIAQSNRNINSVD